MLLERGASEQRGARALGISPTQFGRYVLRYNNPWMQDHVRDKVLSQSVADNMLEQAAKVNKLRELRDQMATVVADARAHINAERAKATANQQKFNEEKQGVVRTHLKKSELVKIGNALEKGETYTPPPIAKSTDWTFACEIDSKTGKLKIAGLNGVVLAQKSYKELGLISGKLHVVADQIEALWVAARAKVATTGDTNAAMLRYFRASGDTKFADEYEAKMRADLGRTDPSHGAPAPRVDKPIVEQVKVAGNGSDSESDYDPAIDGGPDDGETDGGADAGEPDDGGTDDE